MEEKTLSVRELFEHDVEILKNLGEVTVEGWVRNNRNSGKVGFIALHDGTCFKSLQVVYDGDHPFFDEVSHYKMGSAVSFKGTRLHTDAPAEPYRRGGLGGAG